MYKLGPIELVVIIAGLLAYFIPTVIAFSRGHSNGIGIFILNLLLGWTFLGWVGDLVWSLTSTGKQTIVVNNTYSEVRDSARRAEERPKATHSSNETNDYDQRLERLQKLKQMLDNGILSEEEFRKEKSKILAD